MKGLRHTGYTLILGLLLLVPAMARQGAGFDLVTMLNGDIFNGHIEHKQFSMETAHGMVTLSLAMIQSLTVGRGDAPDTLVTALGDRFHGQLQDREIIVKRVLDPTLPLTLDDVSNITFSPRQGRARLKQAPDTVETRDGDLFAARVATSSFLLKGETSIHMVERADIFFMDLMTPEYDDAIRARIVLNRGTVYQGNLLTGNIRVRDRYGNQLSLQAGTISSLAFMVNQHQRSLPHYNYRKRLQPAALFRDRMRDGSPAPEMLVLRGGSYDRGDQQGDDDEKPPVTIEIKPLAIGIYEVTFEEFDRFCDSTGRDKPDDAGWGRGRRPVFNVSWDDARAYTEWLSRQTGQRYRLPTDAEWEYAARGATRTRFWWGDDVGQGWANCAGCGGLWGGEKTSEVGRFEPNPFGLHDTAGNVFEWVADCWNDTFIVAPSDGGALQKPACGIRVIRGGAWSFPPKEVRSANRWRDFQPRISDDTGFRIARDLQP